MTETKTPDTSMTADEKSGERKEYLPNSALPILVAVLLLWGVLRFVIAHDYFIVIWNCILSYIMTWEFFVLYTPQGQTISKKIPVKGKHILIAMGYVVVISFAIIVLYLLWNLLVFFNGVLNAALVSPTWSPWVYIGVGVIGGSIITWIHITHFDRYYLYK